MPRQDLRKKKEDDLSLLEQVTRRMGVTRTPSSAVQAPAPSSDPDTESGEVDAFQLLREGKIQIEFSTDPYEFVFFEYNRECDSNHIRSLKKSLRKVNLIPFLPITVTQVPEGAKVFYFDGTPVPKENLDKVKAVTDGQHRYGSVLSNAYEDGKEFCIAFIEIPEELGDASIIMRQLNTANSNWGKDDLIRNGALAPETDSNRGHKAACTRAYDLMNKYGWVRAGTALYLCGITGSSLKKGKANDRISPQKTARIISELNKLVSIDPAFFRPIRSSKSVSSYIQVREMENFSFDRFYEALHTSFNRNVNKQRAHWATSNSSKNTERLVAFKLAHNEYKGGEYKDAPDIPMSLKEMSEVGKFTS